MKKILTTCPYCGVGCQIYLKERDGKIVGILPSKEGVNEGKLCIKGWAAHEFIHDSRRLTKPLLRNRDGQLEEVDWDKALDYVADRLNKIKAQYGSNAIGLLSSAKCTNEENYLMQKFARVVIGTNNVDHCARLCHASTVAGLAAAFGSGAMTNSIAEFQESDVIFIIGSNTTEQHPLISRRILRAVREKGSKIILADPRQIDIAGFAAVHMRQRSGTDVALINGMMNVIISEGLQDDEFIKNRTENFEALRKTVEKYSPEHVEAITSVPAEKIREAARLYAKADKASIVFSMGITQHTTGVDNVLSTANLAMLTGNVGRDNTGVNPLRGQNNVQGACDVAALSNFYPGYVRMDNEAGMKKLEDAWCTSLPRTAGLTVVEMFNECGKKIHAIYEMGENPMLSDPDINHVRESLKKLDLLVVQDIFMSETAEFAHVVLPSACYAEKDGTFTNTERRVQRVRKAIDPPGEARQDWQIIMQLAQRMGVPMNYGSPKEIMDEVTRVISIYGGMQYERLEGEGLQWPCPNKEHPGTKYLHKDKFSRGLGLFSAVEYLPPAEQVDKDYPLILTTGRVTFHFHTGTMTRKSPTLNMQLSEGYVEVNPKDALKLEVHDNEVVRVKSRRGELTIKTRVSPIVPEGTIFIPFHFVESPANVLTNPALDPKAKIPELKVCAAKITKLN